MDKRRYSCGRICVSHVVGGYVHDCILFHACVRTGELSSVGITRCTPNASSIALVIDLMEIGTRARRGPNTMVRRYVLSLSGTLSLATVADVLYDAHPARR